MNPKNQTKLRLLMLALMLYFPTMVVVRSYLEHKTILDSVFFAFAMLVCFGVPLLVFLPGSRPNRRDKK